MADNEKGASVAARVKSLRRAETGAWRDSATPDRVDGKVEDSSVVFMELEQ